MAYGDFKIVDNPVIPMGHLVLATVDNLVWMTPTGKVIEIPRPRMSVTMNFPLISLEIWDEEKPRSLG